MTINSDIATQLRKSENSRKPRLATVTTLWGKEEVKAESHEYDYKMKKKGNGRTVKKTISRYIKASRQKGISTDHLIEFKCLRELYEKELEQKKIHVEDEIKETSYRASIENEDLNIFTAAGWMECSSTDKLTERYFIQCVEDRCKKEATGEKLVSVDQAARPVAIQVQISKAEDRIWSLGVHVRRLR